MVTRSLVVLVRLLRVSSWFKNLLVFALPLSDGKIIGNEIDTYILSKCVILFFGLSLISTFNYIVNDLADRKYDILHPVKRNRPLASGEVSASSAIMIASVSLLLGIAICLTQGLHLGLLAVLFCLSQLSYTFYWKRLHGIDVVVLALLHLSRVAIPYTFTETPFSPYFIIFFFWIFLFLAFSKRYSEMISSGQDGRKVLLKYNVEHIKSWMNTCVSVSISFYIVWLVQHSEVSNFILLSTLIPFTVVLVRTSNLVYSRGVENVHLLFFRNFLDISLIFITLVLYLVGMGFLF